MMALKRMAVQESNVRLYGIREAAARYGLGLTTFRQFADAAGATVHIGKRVLFDANVLDKAVDDLHKNKGVSG